MYKYLIAFVLTTPLIGIWLVENGGYALSVGVVGYPNGAAVAYAMYAATIVMVASIFRFSKKKRPITNQQPTVAAAYFKSVAKSSLIISSIFLLIFLFGFGAIKVWLGLISKGEFRVGLGTFGAIPNLMTKFILPAMLAYLTTLYLHSKRNISTKLWLFTNMGVVFFIGASWGFKSAALIMLLPSLLILNWNARFYALLKLGIFVIFTIVIFFFIFDAEAEGTIDVFGFLLNRITVIQGDVSWYVWDLHKDGVVFPNYWPTLLAAGGDNLLSIVGQSRKDYYGWMLYHYDWMITYLANVPLDIIADGHSITATPFSEGLVASGVFGVFIFALFAGAIIGLMHRFLSYSLYYQNDIRAAIGATYFCIVIFPWLNAGAAVQLFHISTIVGLILATFLIFTLHSRKNHKKLSKASLQ